MKSTIKGAFYSDNGVQVHGEADAAAVVTVNENPTWRSGEYFYGGDYADNTRSATNKPVEIVAVLPAASPGGEDEISAVTGRVFVAMTPEVFISDADGNVSEYLSASDGSVAAHYEKSGRTVQKHESLHYSYALSAAKKLDEQVHKVIDGKCDSHACITAKRGFLLAVWNYFDQKRNYNSTQLDMSDYYGDTSELQGKINQLTMELEALRSRLRGIREKIERECSK